LGIRFPQAKRLPESAYLDSANVFHVVIHAFPGMSPFSGERGALIWGLLESEQGRPAIRLRAACLMPDHVHVVVQPRERSVVRWVQGFKSYSTHVYAGGVHPRAIWQPSFYDRAIRNEQGYHETVRYVWRNPIEAGLVTASEDWPWVWVNDEDGWVREA
jgi:REP element-mobilizing transposase RayT